jgi:hypothetical protein
LVQLRYNYRTWYNYGTYVRCYFLYTWNARSHTHPYVRTYEHADKETKPCDTAQVNKASGTQDSEWNTKFNFPLTRPPAKEKLFVEVCMCDLLSRSIGWVGSSLHRKGYTPQYKARVLGASSYAPRALVSFPRPTPRGPSWVSTGVCRSKETKNVRSSLHPKTPKAPRSCKVSSSPSSLSPSPP